MYAAKRIGMVDTEYGIIITPQTQAKAMQHPLFGTTDQSGGGGKLKRNDPGENLVEVADKAVMSPFLYTLLRETEKVYLLSSEQVGKRKAAPVGLMGFGCRYCASAGRLGFCRVFPLNKRSLPTKVEDIFKHVKRCTLCPNSVKEQVEEAYKMEYGDDSASSKKAMVFADKDRDFMDQLWKRLGRDGDGFA